MGRSLGMSFTLYGAVGSGSVPVEAAMTLIGLDYRVIEAVTWEGEAERDKVAVATLVSSVVHKKKANFLIIIILLHQLTRHCRTSTSVH